MTASDQSATTMAEIDLDKLEALAKAALKAKGDNARWEALDALEAAANPATILDLIASAREAAGEIEEARRLLGDLVVSIEAAKYDVDWLPDVSDMRAYLDRAAQQEEI